ncbi:uncharacterized protein LOC105662470 [Megachile rotundata]|uniref:uncharacterized protein LOC105662470 n=1 Tax=Megachile rotundata TaxID=143995 RepID=UPI0006150E29|nr:PREDICTED: uncharacterized protein LOC105662470 [Megachile rotundata]
MKCLLFVMFVSAATAAFVPFSETTGKPMKACNGKNSFQRTFNVAHETDCTKFYKCLGRYGFEMDCPTLKGIKLFFNEELQVCDWEGGSNCQGPTEPSENSTTTWDYDTTTSENEISSVATPSNQSNFPEPDCSANPDKKAAHGDKHMYYECEDGKPVEKHCLEHHIFDITIGGCMLDSST